MKGFFKFTFASIIGVIIGLFLFILILVGIISATSREKPLEVKENTVLLMKLDQPIVDRQPESPFEYIDPTSLEPEGRLGLDMILTNIQKASKDENIAGIFLDLTMVPARIATIEEIRNALIAFRDSGKFIIAHSDTYTQSSYYLASVADNVYLNPEGNMFFVGLSSEVIFLKKMLDRLGIDFQVVRHGEYKGATEPLLYEQLSEENRQQIQDYLNDLWGYMVENISGERGIPVDRLNELANNLSVSNSQDALEYQFVDGIKYYDEIIDEIKELTDTPEDKDINSVGLKAYTKAPMQKDYKGLAKNKIAVVYAEGNIVTGEASSGAIGSDKYSKAIRKARRDSSVKAIVLRVNSGGGSGLASEVIWREVKLAVETKPVIASMGDVAASGGYYIVAPATKIFANPNTLTGSIGVFGVFPNMNEFLTEKIGITSDVVKTNEHADFGSVFQGLDNQEQMMLREEIDRFYDSFITKVASGRGMTKERVDEIGRGHVYSGERAMEIGLIDEFGGLDAAIEEAAKQAGVEQYRIVKYPFIEDPLQKIIRQMTQNARLKILEKELGEQYYYYKKLEEIKNMKGIQTRMLYDLRVK